MLKALLARRHLGLRTARFPEAAPALPPRFRGRPEIDADRCADGCAACVAACPTGALAAGGQGPRLDLGRCLFCGDCASACPEGALGFTPDPSLAARRREDLVVEAGAAPVLAEALEARLLRLFGRSLRLRQVSAGGCAGCEVEANALTNVVFDVSRFGIQLVASPRHADGLLVTGPVTENMAAALLATYEAMPPPRLVIAMGACAIAGGPFAGSPEVRGGVAPALPVDLFIPGCPPHPVTVLDGLLRLLGRLEADPARRPRT